MLTVLAVVKLEAAWRLVAIEQRTLVEICRSSLPIVQKTEASERMVHGKVDPVTKLLRAVEVVRVDLIAERAGGDKGRRGDTSETAPRSLGTSSYLDRAARG